MKYRLSPLANKELFSILEYYAGIHRPETGKRIVAHILSDIRLLTSQPNMGHLEPMLKEFPQNFRCLVNVPNYKIIYWIEEGILKIATIFDCRQKPQTIYHIIRNRTDWLCEPNPQYQTITENAQ